MTQILLSKLFVLSLAFFSLADTATFAEAASFKNEIFSVLSSKAFKNIESGNPKLRFSGINFSGGMGGCEYGYNATVYVVHFIIDSKDEYKNCAIDIHYVNPPAQDCETKKLSPGTIFADPNKAMICREPRS